jgi:hypothetical protein
MRKKSYQCQVQAEKGRVSFLFVIHDAFPLQLFTSATRTSLLRSHKMGDGDYVQKLKELVAKCATEEVKKCGVLEPFLCSFTRKSFGSCSRHGRDLTRLRLRDPKRSPDWNDPQSWRWCIESDEPCTHHLGSEPDPRLHPVV